MNLSRFRAGMLAALALQAILSPRAQALEADELYSRVSPGVMMVRVYDDKDMPIGSGSAVLIAPENLLTTCHVLAKAKRIEVKQDNVSYGAELVHIDLERDLCQIRARNFKARPLELGDSDKLRVGKKVYALGDPRGLELTLTDGIISALRRDKDGVTLRYIQTSAPISPGSSGGGLFDSDGKLIGITAMYRIESQNLNFAIPINMLRELPERSRLALARVAAKPAAATPFANKPAAAKPAAEQPVFGARLHEHYQAARNVTASTSATGYEGSRRIRFTTKPDGDLAIAGGDASQYGSGRWGIKDEEQVCIAISSLRYRELRGCYRLYAQEAKVFVLRSVEDGTTIRYVDE